MEKTDFFNQAADLADSSIECCPYCGSDDFSYVGKNVYHCDNCGDDFTYDDCDFCDNCGEQIVPDELITDEDGGKFCCKYCLQKFYNKMEDGKNV